MNLRYFVCLASFLLLSYKGLGQLSTAQEKSVDSLKAIIASPVHDSLKIDAYQAWDDLIYIFDLKLDEQLNRKMIAIAESNLKKSTLNAAERHSFKKSLTATLNTLATIHMSKGDLDQSIELQSKSLAMATEMGDKKATANSLNNLGALHEHKGNSPKALQYYTESLKLLEELGNKKTMGLLYNNIGVIYYHLEEYDKAMEYHLLGLKLRLETGDKKGVGMAYFNIGGLYHVKKDYDKAIDYMSRALKIQQEMDDKNAMATALNNIGAVYCEKKEYAKAMDYFEQSIKAVAYTENKEDLAMALNNIGNIHFILGHYDLASDYNNRAFVMAKESKSHLMIKDAAFSLMKDNKRRKNFGEALKMHELYISIIDSINSEEKLRNVMQQEMQYTYEKQKALDVKEHEKQSAIAAEQKNRQRIITYASGTGLFFVLLFSAFAFNRLRLTRKQKNIIEHQKNMVEQKQLEILDSITYAKRLQDAILPTESLVREHFKEAFILFLPKDIVAGDFYWLEHKNDLLFLAVADCTGHGVPGAMVSVVCSNALNRAVLEFGITEPGKILDKARELVSETFSKSETDVKDGMDISLLCINKKTNSVEWAGAYNPLWYLQNNEIKELKADKQPIGKTENPLPFTTHTVDVKKGDFLFLFTDGFADQFGGEKGKKLKYKPMKELLLRTSLLSAEKQDTELKTAFENWKANLEQVDDVCIIGVRI
ncbi:MAG TPA: tetratricopeptide repeat protein [Bacteroidia bacterium]|jgi:serine phosphatase RsbU (regulator of sigma subunit)/Tfp pilus assembly protein PilF